MTNQPDIVQPRVRRTGKNGNTPAVLAEQSTRVLIRLPKLSATANPTQAQSPAPPLHSIRPQPVQPPSIQSPSVPAKPLSANLASAPAAGQRSHYSTTTELLQGSASAQRPAAPPSPAISKPAARVDAAHAASTGPHLAAPDWLNDRSRKTNTVMQTRLLLVIGAITGFALGALTWHSRGNHVPPTQNSASRIQAPPPGTSDKPHSAVNSTDTASTEFNLPAQVSQTEPEPVAGKDAKESNYSTWQWNPKGAANSPASIGQNSTRTAETEMESATTASTSASDEVQLGDPSRAAWLQGTIDNIHSTPAPVQR